LTLKKWDDERPWLELENCLSSFSPNGRYLALGKQNGHVTVLELPALQQEIADFEKALPK
jgi:hypothetical protein